MSAGPSRRRAGTPSARLKTWWLVWCLLPVLAAFVLQWLPIFNGPHLFLGLPAILWWSCIPGSALVTLVLVVIEKTRPDLARQDELDDEAFRAASELEAAEEGPRHDHD